MALINSTSLYVPPKRLGGKVRPDKRPPPAAPKRAGRPGRGPGRSK